MSFTGSSHTSLRRGCTWQHTLLDTLTATITAKCPVKYCLTSRHAQKACTPGSWQLPLKQRHSVIECIINSRRESKLPLKASTHDGTRNPLPQQYEPWSSGVHRSQATHTTQWADVAKGDHRPNRPRVLPAPDFVGPMQTLSVTGVTNTGQKCRNKQSVHTQGRLDEHVQCLHVLQ